MGRPEICLQDFITISKLTAGAWWNFLMRTSAVHRPISGQKEEYCELSEAPSESNLHKEFWELSSAPLKSPLWCIYGSGHQKESWSCRSSQLIKSNEFCCLICPTGLFPGRKRNIGSCPELFYNFLEFTPLWCMYGGGPHEEIWSCQKSQLRNRDKVCCLICPKGLFTGRKRNIGSCPELL